MLLTVKNIVLLLMILTISLLAQEWQSQIIYFDEENKLVYERDSLGNAIADFSYAGYKNRNDTIPFIPVIKTIQPIDGDNTNHINNAIFEIALNYSVQEDGFRGALLLEKGLYEVNGTIKLNASGIVLRGEGEGENPDSNTVIYGKGNSPNQRTILDIKT